MVINAIWGWYVFYRVKACNCNTHKKYMKIVAEYTDYQVEKRKVVKN